MRQKELGGRARALAEARGGGTARAVTVLREAYEDALPAPLAPLWQRLTLGPLSELYYGETYIGSLAAPVMLAEGGNRGLAFVDNNRTDCPPLRRSDDPPAPATVTSPVMVGRADESAIVPWTATSTRAGLLVLACCKASRKLPGPESAVLVTTIVPASAVNREHKLRIRPEGSRGPRGKWFCCTQVSY